MNNYKKVGLSALCGTLASFSVAHAGSVDITGSVTATYASDGGTTATTGNPWGLSHAFSVGGSGELDNGMAWAYGVAYDADFAGISSSYLSITADGMGTFKLGFDSGDALGGIDDIVPTVWEEADGNGASSGMDKTGGISGGILSFATEADALPLGSTFKASYTPREGGGDSTQNKAVSATGTADTHSGWNVVLAGISPVDGLTLDLGYGEVDRETAVSTYSDDWTQLNGSIKYAMGSVTVGYQRSYEDLGLAAASTTEYYENEGYGLTFNVNDNLSVGYTVFNSSKSFGDTTADVEVEASSFQATYNIGGATVKFAHSEVDNIQYNTALKDEHTVLALGMAF
jgi:outer membrane protein OmpU